jgi:hypothetical protein
MEQKKQTQLIYLESLKSDSLQTSATAVENIKQSGMIEYIPHLIQRMNDAENEEFQNLILSFLHTIKDKNIVKYYIDAINTVKNDKILNHLIQLCWESGFDLSQYGNTFIQITIDKKYDAAIEAFTVIEENLLYFSKEQKSDYSNLLKSNLAQISDDKKPLIAELIKLLTT